MKHFFTSILGLLLLTLYGCGTFRKVSIDQRADRLVARKVHTLDSSAMLIDQSVIRITADADTVITIAGQEINQERYFQMDSLVKGITAIKNDLIDVRLILNPQTQLLMVSTILNPRHIPIKVRKETLIHKDLYTHIGKSESSVLASEITKSTSVKLKTPVQLQYWLVAIIIVVIAITFVFMIGRK